MLKISQKITIEGKSVIDGTIVSNFLASINSDDPSMMTLSSIQVDRAAYKEHRVEVRADEAEFEDYAYSVQDEMIAAIAAENATEGTNETNV